MNRVSIFVIFLSIIILSSAAYAGSGSEFISMKTVSDPFSHWKHQKMNKSECDNCHEAEGGKIAGWGKEAAHTLCIPCHDMNEKGPVECKQCHK
ncbi:MAG: cytochrome c3 family protein [Desulfuromonadaceae bacterium]|nr:cytochrome c3 family protein [Desulfuromonadaceae bacterium]MDD2855676.1 cytochrome c3 family protein [Desulfuromonadaceae bacterium]